ncbi:BLOC-3 complex member HPS4 isoform X2 [Anabrus simplex]|uniref:BLOC-3 complex member HPS4 isoform X2 n=1 Tax=Anabrus simplex TaxID=316456 RepID=UPI0035A2E39C
MAKELFIMFVYDTQRCQREEDDPQDAVLYFHPAWVSDQQRLALCGQLMGATHFFLSAFSCPRILSLNSGKFVVRKCGRYILTVGTDRNIPNWILEHRADTLHQLVQFYHKDFDTMSSAISSENQFLSKLNQIFEVYVPIVQFSGNIFGNIPTIRLPKSASNVYLEALQILQCCQEKGGVLGGIVLYHNKVVATQLGCDLTKRLVSSDPYRLKIPAEAVETPFHLPVGVQLLYVYVENKDYQNLLQNSASLRSAFESVAFQKAKPRKAPPGKMPPAVNKEPISSMKRDTSRIFTVVEEKEGETEDSVTGLSRMLSSQNNRRHSASECPTPHVDKVLHAKVLSICRGSEDDIVNSAIKDSGRKMKSSQSMTLNGKTKPQADRIKNAKCLGDFHVNYCDSEIRSLSMNDLNQSISRSSKRIPLRYYSFGLPRLTHSMCEDEDVMDSPTEKLPPGKRFYNTISDPLHPFFRNNRLPISRSLFDEYLSHHYQLLNMARSPDTSPVENGSLDFSLSSADDLVEDKLCMDIKLTNGINEHKVGNPCEKDQIIPLNGKEARSTKQELYRRSLSLPLKTLSSNGCDSDDKMKNSANMESPSVRGRTLGSLQLTPLMSKLSILAMEDRTSGFCSRETTPGDFRDSGFPGTSSESSVSKRTDKKQEEDMQCEVNSRPEQQGTPEKAVMFVCGQQNMALLLLLEEKLGQDPELIHSLWETSLNGLGRLEIHLRQCLEHFPQNDGIEPYSYICLDPRWDMLQRGGPWGSVELDVVSSMHHDFTQSNSLTEIVVRCEDSTVYGYQCGKTEVFYQQPAGITAGLPTPADLMGVVPLKARRRLERDHGGVLQKKRRLRTPVYTTWLL